MFICSMFTIVTSMEGKHGYSVYNGCLYARCFTIVTSMESKHGYSVFNGCLYARCHVCDILHDEK